MNEKQLKILVVAVLVLGLGSVLMRRGGGNGEGVARLGDKVFHEFKINAITSLTVSEKENSVTVSRTGTGALWINEGLQDFPADYGKVRDLLMKLRDLKISQSHEVDESLYDRFELGPDHDGKEIKLKDAEGKTLYTLWLGKESMGATWVLDRDQPKIVAQVKADFYDASTDVDSWKRGDFFSVDKIKSLEVKYDFNGTRSFSLLRKDNFGTWDLKGMKTNEVVNTDTTGQLDHALGSPSFTTIATPEQVKGANWDSNTTTINIETFEKFKYQIVLAERPGESTSFAKINVSGDLKVEKKDNGPLKLNVDSLSKKKEKLEWEGGLNKWVFVVNNYSFDGVLKNREDLVKEKEPEKKDPPKEKPDLPKENPDPSKKKPDSTKKQPEKSKEKPGQTKEKPNLSKKKPDSPKKNSKPPKDGKKP